MSKRIKLDMFEKYKTISRAEAADIVNQIKEITATRAMAVSAADLEKLAIDERNSKTLVLFDQAIKVNTERLKVWAEANPAEFGKLKSIEFASGKIGFRTGTPKLKLLNRAWNWDKCLEAVQHFLPAFIRNKPEIDKDAIIAQRDKETLVFAIKACGMKVEQDESFFVEPNLTVLATRASAPTERTEWAH